MLVGAARGRARRAALRAGSAAPERFLWLLVAAALGCVLAPELVYVRDAFDGSDLYRMNTVFKLGYHAWLLLALAAACALPWAGALAAAARVAGLGGGRARCCCCSALVYPYAGTYARKGGFSRSPSLDGLAGCAPTAPGDLAAIDWLRANTPGDAVVLEAVGEDYSAFGHARISTFTGRPTVLGWGGHEVQWEHDPGSREAGRPHALHDRPTSTRRATLIDRYGIDYVVVGPIERTTYGDAGLAKWDALGRARVRPRRHDDLAASSQRCS